MTESQSPKMRKAEGWFKLAGAVFAVLGSAWVGAMTLWSAVGNVTTDKELESHNAAPTAHMPLRAELIECRESANALGKRIEKDHQDTVVLGGRMIRWIAADREPNRSLKAAAATYYQEEYLRIVRRGIGVEEAMLESLRSPWYDKPRGQ
jgi:hypothetical protein